MGSTFSDFALQYRVKGASFQLKNSNLTQEAVALNWGFSDASHLHKYLYNPKYWFKRKQKNADAKLGVLIELFICDQVRQDSNLWPNALYLKDYGAFQNLLTDLLTSNLTVFIVNWTFLINLLKFFFHNFSSKRCSMNRSPTHKGMKHKNKLPFYWTFTIKQVPWF